MTFHLNTDWDHFIQNQMNQDYYQELQKFLNSEYQTQTIYPPLDDIFNAFSYTSLSNTKVCIIGQDPYHGPSQAHGLAFSVKKEVSIPPSLVNIFKELQADLGCPIPDHGYLKKWADQGVLLLNTVLTVRAGQAGSHRKKGWEIFTSHIIETLNLQSSPIIFILWGRDAQKKQSLITNSIHPIIAAPHPSPLSAHRGFMGSKPFSKTNALLESLGKSPIDWCIE